MAFNSNSPIDTSEIWGLLGSFYTLLSEEDRSNFENIWDGLVGGTDSLHFNLSEAYLTPYISIHEGVIERGYESYNLVFEGEDTNYSFVTRYAIPLSSGVSPNTPVVSGETYSYSISAVFDGEETPVSLPVVTISGASVLAGNSNTVEWYAVDGVDSYNVYGRTAGSSELLANVVGTTYVDDGMDTPDGVPPIKNTTIKEYHFDLTEPWIWMTIPTLIGTNTEQTLVENTDYYINDLHTLTIPNNFTTTDEVGKVKVETDKIGDISLEVLNTTSTCLLPSLTSIYLPGFGETDDPEKLIRDGEYLPYINGYDVADYGDQRILYTKHLLKWINATTATLRKSPTMDNINDAIALLNNVPFSYEAGTVIDIVNASGSNFVTIENTEATNTTCYDIPDELSLIYNIDDVVDKFGLLASGVLIDDYLSDLPLVSGEMNKEGDNLTFDVYTHNRGGSRPEYFITKQLADELLLGKENLTIIENKDGGSNT
jgi:hypothetical protein